MMVAQSERSLLARIGFFFCRDGRLQEAEEIFNGLAVSAPEKDGPVIGLALCRIIKGETDEAVAMLDARLAKGSDLAGPLSVYKLLAYGMAGRLEEARSLRDDMDREGQTDSVATADQLLEDLSARTSAP